MSLQQAKEIVTAIKNKQFHPVYFLMGEEAYYIDAISDYIESSILSEEEKGFNQMVLYGRDVTIDDIISQAKRYPMMAERQVVIVKEAQDLTRTIENLAVYVENPQPTTILVLCYKYKKLDARKRLAKLIKKHGVLFEGKKLYENQIPNWIKQTLASKGYTITPKAAQMLTEFLGTDLGKINNELKKLQLILPQGAQVSPEVVEENIGISKDFNNFELQNAIGSKDIKKAFAIIQYFGQNPKNNPIVMTVALLYGFFVKLLKYHALSNKGNASKSLGVNPFFIKDYEVAARNYPMKKVSAIISSIREIDMKSKGVGAANMTQSDLLKELLVKIF